MGPSIIFDKSAIQSLGGAALHELSRYFYTVVPPVLLMETLADLSLESVELELAKLEVSKIAKKVLPINSFPPRIARRFASKICWVKRFR